MKEIRWHGRGGQGAKTVSQILAQINLREGKYVQAFPEFGPERSGAPIRAYNRISDREIFVHSSVYEPDIVVVLDESLLDTENPTEGLKPKGVLLVNSTCSAEELRARLNFSGRIIVVDADRIAKETGTGFPNIPMLGALVAVLGTDYELAASELREALGGRLSQDMLDRNLRAFRAGYEAVKEVRVG